MLHALDSAPVSEPAEVSKEEREARYRIITISLLVAFAFYVLYKISVAG